MNKVYIYKREEALTNYIIKKLNRLIFDSRASFFFEFIYFFIFLIIFLFFQAYFLLFLFIFFIFQCFFRIICIFP